MTLDIRTVPGGLVRRAIRWADEGFVGATVMLGTGFDDDDRMDRFVDDLLEASTTSGIPIYLETHRATITQDIWRTLRLVERHPEIRFNGDFSHWYTGHDLGAADFPERLELLRPVLDRVRYLHGRIGTCGSIQVALQDDDREQPPVTHFRALWEASFEGFLRTADDDVVPCPDGAMGFAPELLPAEFGYALTIPQADGARSEISDRWEQASLLTSIAADCFSAAESRVIDSNDSRRP